MGREHGVRATRDARIAARLGGIARTEVCGAAPHRQFQSYRRLPLWNGPTARVERSFVGRDDGPSLAGSEYSELGRGVSAVHTCIPDGRSFEGTDVMGNACSVLGARCSVLGARCSVLGARCSVLGARCSVLGARCSVLEVCVFEVRGQSAGRTTSRARVLGGRQGRRGGPVLDDDTSSLVVRTGASSMQRCCGGDGLQRCTVPSASASSRRVRSARAHLVVVARHGVGLDILMWPNGWVDAVARRGSRFIRAARRLLDEVVGSRPFRDQECAWVLGLVRDCPRCTSDPFGAARNVTGACEVVTAVVTSAGVRGIATRISARVRGCGISVPHALGAWNWWVRGRAPSPTRYMAQSARVGWARHRAPVRWCSVGAFDR
ncbi:hypothetical protein HNR16_003131 [Pseudoclavibacter chungangensis]|nr:hypothetical protein [Pseudoclavibacter chungangensis]